MNKIHWLKTWPVYFNKIKSGEKTCEVRRDDRLFSEGDYLVLEEWNPEDCKFTGRRIKVKITHLLKGSGFGIKFGYCVISFKKIAKAMR